MVLLTMTALVVEALGTLKIREELEAMRGPDAPDEPSLESPAIGLPISHGQIVGLWKVCKTLGLAQYSLEALLQGARVYVPPPPPKPEPVSGTQHTRQLIHVQSANVGGQSDEYKALMARLRREEEESAYERMMSAPPRAETFGDRYAHASMQTAFEAVNRPLTKADLGDNDVTYADAHRQVMLIINFLVSIFGSGVTIWYAARWWNTPARLFITMGGALLVAVAEVVVYSGFVRRMAEAKRKQEKVKEVKEIVNTWVVTDEDKGAVIPGDIEPHGTTGMESTEKTAVRRRRKTSG